jgi:xanthine dehydrogenase accessory factor
MTCHRGGTVEIYIQPVLPVPRLLVFGTSPTARALARLGKAMGYTVHVVDPHADAADFPEADAVFTALPPPTRGSSAPLFAAVATQGQWDEDALVAAAAHAPAYLGVVASPKRFAEMRSLLAGRVPASVLDAVQNPAGLDLGAKGPEEVALSVLAQIVKERSAARQPREQPPPPAAAEARDPICGMTVAVEGALHRATHEGREYFFCCAGCRERFAAAPDRYAVPVG